MPEGFIYASDTNTEWVSVGRLRELMAEFQPADPSFDTDSASEAVPASDAERAPLASVPQLGVARFAG